MNFDNMPELHSRYGYYAAWAIMLVVAVGMLLFFKKRGWIGGSSNKENTPES
jgi:magnesium transporter